MRKSIRRSARRAFTLIELLLVLIIIGVLAAIVVPKFVGQSEDAKIKAAKGEISTIEGALNQFELDNGRYPDDLNSLVVQPGNAKVWHQYLDHVPKDPWGNAYVYVKKDGGNGAAATFELHSMGPDGNDGTADDVKKQ